jgi:hypothetical protein
MIARIRKGTLRRIGFCALVIAAVIVGIAAASVAHDPGDAPAMFSAGAFASDGTPPRIGARVPEVGTELDWAVRVYHSVDGFENVQVGRVERGVQDPEQFKVVDQRTGEVRALPIGDGGSPVDLTRGSEALFVNRYPLRTDGRVVIFGLVDQDVVRVTLRLAGGDRDLPIEARTFIARADEDSICRGTVVFVDADGASRTDELRCRAPAGAAVPPTDG